MTEPTSNQLKEARKISEALSILSAKDIAVFIAYIRREATNAALEEAATYLETKRIITDNRVVCTRAEIELRGNRRMTASEAPLAGVRVDRRVIRLAVTRSDDA